MQSSVVQAVFVNTPIANNDSGLKLLAVINQQALTVGPYVFYPVGGILADVYLGRHVSARICLLLVWAASAVFAVSATIGNNLYFCYVVAIGMPCALHHCLRGV